jgi:hypothetical protein
MKQQSCGTWKNSLLQEIIAENISRQWRKQMCVFWWWNNFCDWVGHSLWTKRWLREYLHLEQQLLEVDCTVFSYEALIDKIRQLRLMKMRMKKKHLFQKNKTVFKLPLSELKNYTIILNKKHYFLTNWCCMELHRSTIIETVLCVTPIKLCNACWITCCCELYTPLLLYCYWE